MDLLNDNKDDKSNIFFGSSTKYENLAKDLIEILKADKNIVCIPWRDISDLGQISFLEPLFDEFKKCDFAVFIFGPDDTVIKDKFGKEEEYFIPRDNVIFEAGFSMGKIGKDRTFLVTPDDIQDFHLLTDLSGFTTATYKHEGWKNGEKTALDNAADKIKKKVEKLGKRRTICTEFGITPEIIKTFYRMSRLTYAYMNRREALEKMLADIERAKKSVEMYARVYISELIKDPAIKKAVLSATKKNGLRIRHVSTDYSKDSLVMLLWNLEDPSHHRWTSFDKYKFHLEIESNAPFKNIKEYFSKNKSKRKYVIFERAYLIHEYPLPFSMLSIDDETLYISFYDLGADPNFGTFAPTIRFVCKKNRKDDDKITWADLFLKYKQNIDEKFLSEIEMTKV